MESGISEISGTVREEKRKERVKKEGGKEREGEREEGRKRENQIFLFLNIVLVK